MERKSKPRQDLTGQKFNMLTPIEYVKGGKWKCKCDCGNETIVDTRNLKSGHTKSCGCQKKATKNVIDMSGFETEGIKVLEREGSDNQQIATWKCKCKYCGRIFIARGSWLRMGEIQSCGCLRSKGEQQITKILLENNIEFATQYSFPDLKDERVLRFDFAVFEKGQLKYLIEYNGLQHYEKAKGSWGQEYETLRKHDLMKQEYCKKHNLKLVVIRYDENISDILPVSTIS